MRILQRATLTVIGAAMSVATIAACSAPAPATENTAHRTSQARAVDAFVPWLVRAGSICPQIGPSLLAAQVDEESGFEPHEPGPAGTSGYSQLDPMIWSTFGAPVDAHGNPVGPSGAGDPNSIADSVMALGHYMCFLGGSLDVLVSDGAVTGTDDPAELYLAAFTGGLSAVTSERGFPTNSDLLRAQVDEVLAAETEYRWIR